MLVCVTRRGVRLGGDRRHPAHALRGQIAGVSVFKMNPRRARLTLLGERRDADDADRFVLLAVIDPRKGAEFGRAAHFARPCNDGGSRFTVDEGVTNVRVHLGVFF